MENIDEKDMVLYYQVDYIQTEVPNDAAYFHAQFRRVNSLPYKTNYVLVDSIEGKGQYVGTYLAWVCTIMAGGVKARSSSIWMEILTGLLSAERNGGLLLRFIRFRYA